MNLKAWFTKENKKNLIFVGVLLIVALLSVFVFANIATSSQTHKETIKSINEKKSMVMNVNAGAATAATAIAAVPGGTTEPIANQIMQTSSYLLVAVSFFMMEKALITILGLLSFRILIPIACALLAAYLFSKKKNLKILAYKLAIIAMVIVTIIPVSIKVGDMIYDANEETIGKVAESISEAEDVEVEKKKGNWWNELIGNVKTSVSKVGEKAKEVLNSFMDVVSLFLIAYCATPLLVALFAVWLIRFLFKLLISNSEKKESALFPETEKGGSENGEVQWNSDLYRS